MAETYLDYLDQEMPVPNDAWQVEDDSQAIWCLRKIAAAEAGVAARRQVMAREMARLQAWVEQSEREAAHTRAFFSGKLEGYLRRLRDEGKLSGKKSRALPNGILQLRNVPPSYDGTESPVFLEWCVQHGFSETVVKPKVAEAKKCFSVKDDGTVEAIDMTTGELIAEQVPGIVVTRQAHETFSIKLAEDKDGEA
jgi:hypothetical protein